MDDLSWVTTPLTDDAVDAALGLLGRDGAALPAPAPGSVRHHVGAVDLDEGTLGAVAVVDVDPTGTARVQAVAGDPGRLTGLADLLRAAGARRMVAGAPLGDGWNHTGTSSGTDAPGWALDL